MDVVKYLNSSSVAKYLKEINYRFSPQEAAFVIKRSRKTSLDEKIKAWNELIATTPDCAMAVRFDCPRYPSLHQFLLDHIALVKKLGEGIDESTLKDDERYLYTAFDFMWFKTPAPFKRGDIVYNPYSQFNNQRQPVVLANLSYWDESDYRANGYNERDCDFESLAKRLADSDGRDCSDMSAHGYFMQDKQFDYDWIWIYLDLEYYDKELSQDDLPLLPLSNYLKGKLSLEKFLNGYLLLRDRKNIEEGKAVFQEVDEENLSLVGLKR